MLWKLVIWANLNFISFAWNCNRMYRFLTGSARKTRNLEPILRILDFFLHIKKIWHLLHDIETGITVLNRKSSKTCTKSAGQFRKMVELPNKPITNISSFAIFCQKGRWNKDRKYCYKPNVLEPLVKRF